MGINTKEFAVKFTGELDKVLCQQSAVGFMTDNVMRCDFVGAKTVKIPSISMEGLGDYDRESGFISGAVNVSNSLYEMKQDRARTFSIDKEDLDETGVAELAGSVMSEFVRTKVVPETDAYVLSKLCGVAGARGQILSDMDTTKPFECFNALLTQVQSAAGFDEEVVCFVNPYIWQKFRTSDEFSRFVTMGELNTGNIKSSVHFIDNVPIIPVSNLRMQTAYNFLNGKNSESAGGFSVANGAKGIYMLMLPRKAASLVRKNETVRTFTPEQNLTADAYKFDYRIYYDVFVKNAYATSIWASFAPLLAISDVPKTVSVTPEEGMKEIKFDILSDHESDDISIKWYSCDDENKSNPRRVNSNEGEKFYFDCQREPGTYYIFARVTVAGASVAETNVCAITIE